MRVLVVTGGIGAGKSVVCSMLRDRGIPVYDSDSRAKALYDEDPLLRASVVQLFGEGICTPGGLIDRKKLASLVFGDPSALARLEALVHPAVFRDFDLWKKSLEGVEMAAYESAIALEKGLPEGFADAVVYVDAPLELRLARAAERDGSTAEALRARATVQTSCAGHPMVDYVIENGTDLDSLALSVDTLLDSLCESWKCCFRAAGTQHPEQRKFEGNRKP